MALGCWQVRQQVRTASGPILLCLETKGACSPEQLWEGMLCLQGTVATPGGQEWAGVELPPSGAQPSELSGFVLSLPPPLLSTKNT